MSWRGYETTEAGKRWGVSSMWVSQLCKQGRVPGPEKIGGIWLIPDDARSQRTAVSGTEVYRREPATPEIPEKMRSPLLHSASLCTPAASRSGRWLCDRDEALRCYIRRRAGCLCNPELRSAALSCLWGYHVRPWDQTASCDRLGWRVSLVSAASMAVPSLSELSPRAPGLHGPAAAL